MSCKTSCLKKEIKIFQDFFLLIFFKLLFGLASLAVIKLANAKTTEVSRPVTSLSKGRGCGHRRSKKCRTLRISILLSLPSQWEYGISRRKEQGPNRCSKKRGRNKPPPAFLRLSTPTKRSPTDSSPGDRLELQQSCSKLASLSRVPPVITLLKSCSIDCITASVSQFW